MLCDCKNFRIEKCEVIFVIVFRIEIEIDWGSLKGCYWVNFSLIFNIWLKMCVYLLMYIIKFYMLIFIFWFKFLN